MQYSEKDYQFLGKQVAAGRYVSISTFALSIVLALLVGLCLGRYVFPNAPDTPEGGQKRPLSQGSDTSNALDQNRERLQSIFRHEEDVRKDPTNAEAWEHLGNLYYDAGEPRKAVTAYTKALELVPNNASVLVDCGVMYRELQEYDNALKYFNKALDLDPKHQFALFNSGIVLYFDLDKKEEALANWNKLLKLNSEFKVPSGQLLSKMLETLS